MRQMTPIGLAWLLVTMNEIRPSAPSTSAATSLSASRLLLGLGRGLFFDLGLSPAPGFHPPPTNSKKYTTPISSPATIVFPSGVIAQHLKWALVGSVETTWPVATSHTLRVLSSDAETASRPSGLSATPSTLSHSAKFSQRLKQTCFYPIKLHQLITNLDQCILIGRLHYAMHRRGQKHELPLCPAYARLC